MTKKRTITKAEIEVLAHRLYENYIIYFSLDDDSNLKANMEAFYRRAINRLSVLIDHATENWSAHLKTNKIGRVEFYLKFEGRNDYDSYCVNKELPKCDNNSLYCEDITTELLT